MRFQFSSSDCTTSCNLPHLRARHYGPSAPVVTRSLNQHWRGLQPGLRSDGVVMTVSAGQNSARPAVAPALLDRSIRRSSSAFWPLGACPVPGPALPLPRPFSRPLRPVFGPGSGLGGVLGLLDCCPVARGLLCDQDGCSLRPSAACLVKSSRCWLLCSIACCRSRSRSSFDSH